MKIHNIGLQKKPSLVDIAGIEYPQCVQMYGVLLCGWLVTACKFSRYPLSLTYITGIQPSLYVADHLHDQTLKCLQLMPKASVCFLTELTIFTRVKGTASIKMREIV